MLGVSPALAAPIVARLRGKGLLFSPTRGHYVPIPPEYRAWGGTVPASHFIDQFMASMAHPYYVGLLSAAEVYGVAHQHPQVFQVVTDARLRGRSFGRVRLEFITSARVGERPTRQVNTPTGTMRVSTPEVTALDLVTWPEHGGGLSNACTVLVEMLEATHDCEPGAIDIELLATAALGYPIAVRQRLGWLLEFAGSRRGEPAVGLDLGPLRATIVGRSVPARLNPALPRRGAAYDESWNLFVNTTVEPDL